MSTNTTAAPEEIRVMMATTYLALSIIGIVPNILLGITLIQKRGKLLQTCFFMLTTQILLCDLGELLTQIIIAFPLSLYGKNIYDGEASIYVYYVVNIVDTISYNGVLLFTFVVALNRISVFVWPKLQVLLFSHLSIWRTILAVWCFIIIEVTGVNLLQCWKNFAYDEFYFFIKCYNNSYFSFYWLEFMRYQSFALPIIMFVVYILLFVHLRWNTPKRAKMTAAVSAKRKAEIKLLIQAVIITVFLELQTLSFTFLPQVGTGYNKYYSSLAQNVISICNNSVNPYVYFLINRQIRRDMIALVCGKRKEEKKITLTKAFDLTNI
ncbi:unnamed protein product [Cylicocyclus nassatus]|uniref:G-protein coupled receptors family 1 profile domain-containing protein n=1 Tax=Cylicocyclus nassatus TaxID=53992 RepID=A0AA36DI93_CYLNA|nr:unnamed protein product [Cylicocyclus nassatus]